MCNQAPLAEQFGLQIKNKQVNTTIHKKNKLLKLLFIVHNEKNFVKTNITY